MLAMHKDTKGNRPLSDICPLPLPFCLKPPSPSVPSSGLRVTGVLISLFHFQTRWGGREVRGQITPLYTTPAPCESHRWTTVFEGKMSLLSSGLSGTSLISLLRDGGRSKGCYFRAFNPQSIMTTDAFAILKRVITKQELKASWSALGAMER